MSFYKISYFEPGWDRVEYGASLSSIFSTHAQNLHALQALLSNLEPDRRFNFYGNGKSALLAILQSWGIRPGDEIIVPAFLCASAIQPIERLGARPVAVDVDPGDLNISFESLKRHVTARTRVILVAHLYGNAADIPTIAGFAAEHSIKVLDDAAQSFGASLNNTLLGFWGDAGVIAFGPGKSTVGARGGIAIHRQLTLPAPNPESIGSVYASYGKFVLRRCFRRWTQPVIDVLGRSKELTPDSTRIACKSSFTFAPMAEIDAAIAKAQIRRVQASLITLRKRNFEFLEKTLVSLPAVRPIKPQRGMSSWVKFALVLEPSKAGIFALLRKRGIEVYPSYEPLTFYKPNPTEHYFADSLAQRVLELPLMLSDERTRWMATVVRETLEEAA